MLGFLIFNQKSPWMWLKWICDGRLLKSGASGLILPRQSPSFFFLFIITAMRKGSGCHGDSFSNIFVGQLKVESAHICVCDVWFPGATNGVDESSGHYVEASRALETFPLHFSLTLAISFPFISSLHPGPTRLTKALQWQQWKQGRESAGQVEMNEAETTGVLTGTIHAANTSLYITKGRMHFQSLLHICAEERQLWEIKPGWYESSCWPLFVDLS